MEPKNVCASKVTLTNTATGERRTTQSGGGGNYQFVNLIPGHYRVEIENPGFKHLTRDAVEVSARKTVFGPSE